MTTLISEPEIIERIQLANLTESERERLQALSQRLELESLDDNEHSELLMLADKSERLNVERMQAIAELATKRGETLEIVMTDLGLLNQANALTTVKPNAPSSN